MILEKQEFQVNSFNTGWLDEMIAAKEQGGLPIFEDILKKDLMNKSHY